MSVDGTPYDFLDSSFQKRGKTSFNRQYPLLTVSTQSSKKNSYMNTPSPYKGSSDKESYANDYIFRDSATKKGFDNSTSSYVDLLDRKRLQNLEARIDRLENNIEESERGLVEALDIPSSSFLSKGNNFESFLERIHYDKIWDRLGKEKKSADPLSGLSKGLNESLNGIRDRTPLKKKVNENERSRSFSRQEASFSAGLNENKGRAGCIVKNTRQGLKSSAGRLRESSLTANYMHYVDESNCFRQNLLTHERDSASLNESMKAQMGVLEEENQIKSKMDYINTLYEEMNLSSQQSSQNSLKVSKKNNIQSSKKSKSQKRDKSKEPLEKKSNKAEKLIITQEGDNKLTLSFNNKIKNIQFDNSSSSVPSDENSSEQDFQIEKTLKINQQKGLRIASSKENDNLTYLEAIQESARTPDEFNERIIEKKGFPSSEDADLQVTKKGSMPVCWPNMQTPVKNYEEGDSKKYNSVELTPINMINSRLYSNKKESQQRSQIKRNNTNFIQKNKNVEENLRPKYKTYEKAIRNFDSVCNPLISSLKKYEDEPKYCFTTSKRGCSVFNSRYQSPDCQSGWKSRVYRSPGDMSKQTGRVTQSYMKNPDNIQSFYEGISSLSEKIAHATNVMQQALGHVGRYQNGEDEE